MIDDDLREPADIEAGYQDHGLHRPSGEKQSLYVLKPRVPSQDDL